MLVQMYPSVVPLLLHFTLFFTSSPCLPLSAGTHARIHTIVFRSSSISNSLWCCLYSSCLRHPGKLHFVFNIVEFPACSGRPAGRRGLCTGGLYDLINPVLVFPGMAESSSKTAQPKVMSTLEIGEPKLDCANLWTLVWYVSRFCLISAHIWVQALRHCNKCNYWLREEENA